MPIENSTEGTVNNTLDMFLTSPLKICGEVELRIHQHLMGRMTALEKIVRVCAHPQALAQCRGWLDEHLPDVERVPVSSNAEGARRARDEEGTAAIAGQAAAEVYGLNVLVPEIEDRPDNTTRFLVIGRKLFSASGADKTTLLVSAGDTQTPGALFRLLEPLARTRISMTRIESRPSRRRKWDYVFFIDLDGHADEQPVRTALAELKERASLFRVLGSYPRGGAVSAGAHGHASTPTLASTWPSAPVARRSRPMCPASRSSELAREFGVSDSIKLASNENPLGPGPRGAGTRCAGAARQIWLYPDGSGFELKPALARQLRRAAASASRSATARTTCWCCWPKRS